MAPVGPLRHRKKKKESYEIAYVYAVLRLPKRRCAAHDSSLGDAYGCFKIQSYLG